MSNLASKDRVHQQIKLLLETSFAMNCLIDDYPSSVFKFQGPDYKKFKDMTWVYVRLFSALARTYMERGCPLFDVTIKLHYLIHVMLQAEWLNPRLSWTFSGEDFMHIMKILAQSCVRGTKSPQVASKMLAKYRVCLELRFKEVVVRKGGMRSAILHLALLK